MTPTSPTSVRPMRWDDIPRILQIADESSSCWLRADFRTVFQSHETLGFVAESAGEAKGARQIAGFAICRVERGDESWSRARLSWWRRFTLLLGGSPVGTARRITLIAIAASRDAADASVELALLKHLDCSLRLPTDRLEAVVPETDAGAQAFLRDAGFLAVRVVPGYYCHIDGYLMARDNRLALAAADCEPERPQVETPRRSARPR